MDTLLSIGKAAERLGVSVDTVRKLENAGELKSVRTAGGHRRFAPSVLDAWLARHSATTRRRRPVALPPPRRREAARVIQEEPLDEGWDEPEPARRAQPTTPAPKPFGEQLLDDLRQRNAEVAERNRLANLKSYGASLIPYDSTASARSAVIEELDSYVTTRRFPPSTDWWDARRAIEAKVQAVLEPFNEASAREAAEKAEEAAREAAEEGAERDAEQRVESLVAHGKTRTFIATTRWRRDDREEARADIEEVLEREVEADWLESDVDDLVDEILDEWEEEDA